MWPGLLGRRQLILLSSASRFIGGVSELPSHASLGLGRARTGQHRQQLVTTGIRSRVRHPIYLGHLCEILGWCIGTGLIPLYVLALFAVSTGAVMIRMEDRELEARFGDAYREYRARVPAVVPGFPVGPVNRGFHG